MNNRIYYYIVVSIVVGANFIGTSIGTTKEAVATHDYRSFSDSYRLTDEEKTKLNNVAYTEPDAAFRLYQYYMIYKGDYLQGVRWLRIAAANGHIIAMYNYGILLSDGMYYDDNIDDALIYFRKSFEAGYSAAAVRIAEIYLNHDNYQDKRKAIYWYKKAVEAGNELARRKLKEIYQKPDSEMME